MLQRFLSKKKEKRKILVPCPTITGEGRIT